MTHLSLPTTPDFDFPSTITSHGWVVLLPNVYDKETYSFSRIEALPGGQAARLTVSSITQNQVKITVESPDELLPSDKKHIKQKVRHMLRLDEDYTDFYVQCQAKGAVWAGLACGQGRMLRSPSLFEDLVKVICTTNIQWGGTKRMVRELVDAYGTPFTPQPELKAFPAPQAIASDSLDAFKGKVNLGYRAAYIHELSVRVADGSLDLSELADDTAPTAEIRKKLKGIKGIGDYAATSMLMLLGRYDEIPTDTVFRDHMRKNHAAEGDFDLKQALAVYEDWGCWKALAYWFEMLESE
ncbi:MAG: DNA-3-methyladenine glycosylase 2 family protein [Chloroflexi bacterium]|nr:DNA-3-methyladenine glycosylase 2 family protein [Chloroflexota bacterium]